MKVKYDNFRTIEDEFFAVDHENRMNNMQLEFDKPSDIFNDNILSKTKIFTEEFRECVKNAFECTPREYKLNINVMFNDMEGYTNEELNDIFKKNTILATKKSYNSGMIQNKIAIGLIIIGVILLSIMLFVTSSWDDGGVAKEMVIYIMNIGTTVTFWEALTILIVKNKENRDFSRNVIKKYGEIKFLEKEK